MPFPTRRRKITSLALTVAVLLSLTTASGYAMGNPAPNISSPSNPSLDLLLEDWNYDYEPHALFDIEPDPDIGKTDRYIVKYKTGQEESFKSKLPHDLVDNSLSLDDVNSNLRSLEVIPDNNSGRNNTNPNTSYLSAKYPDLEVLILSEKMLLSELEEVLESSGAYSDILYIQPDYELEIASLNPGFITRAEQPAAPITGPPNTSSNSVSNGLESSSPTLIAVLDTAVDPTHPAYSSYLHPETPDVYDPSNPLAYAHGTHVAGAIANEASLYNANIQILALPVFSDGYAYTSDIIIAIETAELMGASIVNCSFGNSSFNQALFEAMEASSMLFICAAGNGREDLELKPVYPACFELGNVLSVGSVNNDLGFSYYSNYNQVDMAA